ncbi:NADH-quinone oxidoreductase subunit M [Nonomuraea phyllanthi]|uniref:NADH-quinone oxidoreductase subunit M n=1 Tax=Nonomuraea phyllanthi TaxID=2219224 RepID=A0A5C4VXV4_9ACTN|nr:NADH-quinone oxidoreductase subunit M [Nonomuraea phyllanthi]KAB8190520.1 NADH-quinone oxidoreductase subunit M [Nonomuraea phyllanthi]QFY05705.1 NADH-quinone oxidoreductase subunit M [Nonomuraea phyllanthi]
MSPWLPILMAVPVVGAIVVALLPKGSDKLAKQLTLLFSLLTLVLTGVMAAGYKPTGPRFQFAAEYDWIPSFGVKFGVGVDGVALVLIALSVVLVPIVVLASWNDADGVKTADGTIVAPKRSVKTYFSLLLVLETMMIGVFAATDVFLFYVFFEAMLIPMYFMIGSYGGAQRSYAAVKFLLYSLFGGLLMLVAVIGLYVLAGSKTFMFPELVGAIQDPAMQKWLFGGFFIAFAIKAPLWPVHTWLPDAAAQAPAGAAVLLVGVLDKVGTFGMLRFCLELFPDAAKAFTMPIVVLAVISIIYGAIVAIGQTDMKRLIAYTSISHFGFIVLGVFAMSDVAQSGAALYMVNHGFATGALFLAAGFLIARRGSPYIKDYGGVQKVAPLLAGFFLIAGLAGLSLPGLSSFVSEFMVMIGTYSSEAHGSGALTVAAGISALAVILAAVYILWMVQRTLNGPTAEPVKAFKDLNAREVWVLAPLVALIIGFGFFPKPLLDVINPSVQATLTNVHVPTSTIAEKGTGQ